jgi:glucose/arabinose dehydrogenase
MFPNNRSLFVAGSLSLALSMAVPACAQEQSGAVERSQLLSFRVVTVAEGLQNPWSIAFLPGGDLLVTERPGRLRIVRNGVVQPPVSGVPEVLARGQGGLLDVVLHPQFATNRLVYLSYSKPGTGRNTTAIVRGRLDGNALSGVQEIFEADAWATTNGHFGSRMAFDRQGYLFITIGDRQAPPSGNLENHPAQLLSNTQGKIVRLHDDGRVPTDNPFVGRPGVRPEIWSYGHRSPQGLAIHPETGDIWMTEHGPQGGDELNLVLPGRNYGWPIIGYGVNYGGARIHASTERAGLEQPAHYWVPSIATSGLMIYTGDRFPQWRGNLFAGGMVGEHIARLTMDGRRVASVENLLQGRGRVRDIRQGPDGLIYVALDEGSGATLLRLEPAS